MTRRKAFVGRLQKLGGWLSCLELLFIALIVIAGVVYLVTR